MDYEKLHKDTITKLQEMVNSGKITAETARGICADFIPESERIRKSLIDMLKNDEKHYLKEIAWLEKQKSEEINVKALLTADKLAAAEMTGRLKERKDIVENPQKYGLEKQGKKEPVTCPICGWEIEKQGEQKPAEWSEEDEKCIRLSMDIIESALRAGFCVQLYRDRCVDWLNSLRSQKQWIPSEEQMNALDDVISSRDIKYDVLSELWKDLNKLREE